MCSHPCSGDLQTDCASQLLIGPVKPCLHTYASFSDRGGAHIKEACLNLSGQDKRKVKLTFTACREKVFSWW